MDLTNLHTDKQIDLFIDAVLNSLAKMFRNPLENKMMESFFSNVYRGRSIIFL